MTIKWPPKTPPEIPPEISHAARNNSLVIFVGAGTSKLMGCPSWEGLANNVLQETVRKRKLNYGELRELSILDPKKKFCIHSFSSFTLSSFNCGESEPTLA